MITQPTADIEAVQDLFATDVREFNRRQGVGNFHDAVLKYYSRLNFETEWHAHARPYYYLTEWGPLFHPPVKRLTLPLSEYYDGFPAEFDPRQEDSEFFRPEFQRGIDAKTGTELTYGNELKLYSNGSSYPEKLRLVREAKRTLFISVMAFMCAPGDTTSALIDEIIARKQAGVDVRILGERFYRETMSHFCVDRLLAAGVDFQTVSDSFRSDTQMAAMHQKVWLRDGVELIIGGENILGYENDSTGFNHKNRDADMLVHGPAVTDAYESFIRKWQRYAGDRGAAGPVKKYLDEVARTKSEEKARGVRGTEQYAAWLGNPETRMNGICRIALQGAAAKIQPIGPILEEHIRASRHSIYFTTPDIPFDVDAPENRGLQNTHIAKITRLLQSRTGPDDPRIHVFTNGVGGGAGEISIFWRMRAEEARREGHYLHGQLLPAALRHLGLARRQRQPRRGASRCSAITRTWTPGRTSSTSTSNSTSSTASRASWAAGTSTGTRAT